MVCLYLTGTGVERANDWIVTAMSVAERDVGSVLSSGDSGCDEEDIDEVQYAGLHLRRDFILQLPKHWSS